MRKRPGAGTAVASAMISEVATAPHDDARCRDARSFVASERLGLEPRAFGAILENVGDADCGLDPLDPALHQLEVGVVAQPERVQPLSLGPGDVTGRGTALRVSVCVVPDEGLPVHVARPFDRFSNLFAGEWHGSSLLLARLGSIRSIGANATRHLQPSVIFRLGPAH